MDYMAEANAIALELRSKKKKSCRKFTTEPTEKQGLILAFMRAFLIDNDEMPPMWAVSKHFGFRSANSAQDHVKALIKKGHLERNSIGNLRFARLKEAA